jgi:phosphatidylglycerol---prolipoprotein diacylglyceryl transferase
MLQTLFYIPESVGPLPVFGFGWALLAWAAISAVSLFVLVRRQGFSGETLGYVPLLLALGAAIYYIVPGMVEPGRGLPIRGFGVMMLLGVVSGVGLSVYRARRMGVDPEVIFSLAFWMFIFGILGARLFYAIEYPQRFVRDSLWETLQAVANVPEGGIVLYGAFFGGIGAALVFFAWRKLPPLAIADIIAPGMVVGAAFGRVGCFLNGCCFGGLCTTELPAVTFPRESPPFMHQLEHGWFAGFSLATENERVLVQEVFSDSPAAHAGLQPGDEIADINGHPIATIEQARQRIVAGAGSLRLTLADGTRRQIFWALPSRSWPVHPAQLYDALNLALLALVVWLYYPLRRHDGETLALLLTLYPITRFVIEIIRVDEPGQLGTELSISQLISFGVFAAAIALWIYVEARRLPRVLPWHDAGSPTPLAG